MFKLLFTGLLIYMAYKFFFAPPPVIDRFRQINDELRRGASSPKHAPKDDDEGEYVDYEEVKDK
jgi:hypothetical protein